MNKNSHLPVNNIPYTKNDLVTIFVVALALQNLSEIEH